MKNYRKDCIVLSDTDSIIACGSGLGTAKIYARIALNLGADDTDPWMGLVLSFPLGPEQKANIESGFGVKYTCKLMISNTGTQHRQLC